MNSRAHSPLCESTSPACERIPRRSLSDRRTGWTDWARIDRQTDEEIAASVASDPDAAPLLTEEWFAKAVIAPQQEGDQHST